MRVGSIGLRWVPIALALVAACLLPAFSATAPLLPHQDWTLAQVAIAPIQAWVRHQGHSTNHGEQLGQLVRDAQRLDRQIGRSPGSGSLHRALVAATAIPAAAGVTFMAVLVLPFLQWAGLHRSAKAVASIGLAAALYDMLAANWLTRAVHSELAASLQRGGGAMASMFARLAAQLIDAVSIRAEVGLFVIVFSLLGLLIAPASTTL